MLLKSFALGCIRITVIIIKKTLYYSSGPLLETGVGDLVTCGLTCRVCWGTQDVATRTHLLASGVSLFPLPGTGWLWPQDIMFPEKGKKDA